MRIRGGFVLRRVLALVASVIGTYMIVSRALPAYQSQAASQGDQASVAGLACPEDVRAKAVNVAERHGLQDAPTSVQCKQMTYGEFSSHIGEIQDPNAEYKPDMPVQLAVMTGTVVIEGLPGTSGRPSYSEYDNAYVLFDSSGQDIGFGAMAPGHKIDLTKPAPSPLYKYPDPPVDEQQKCADAGNCPATTAP